MRMRIKLAAGLILAVICALISISNWINMLAADPVASDVNIRPVQSGPIVALETRRLTVPSGHGSTEMDAVYIDEIAPVDLSRTAIVVMDAWATHPTEGWAKRASAHMETHLVPLLTIARNGNMSIIHIPNGGTIAPAAMPLDGEAVMDGVGISTAGFRDYLRQRGIDTLIYCGYASNWCVTTRPTGLIFMQREGFRTFIVRDGCIGFETPESYDGQWGHRMAVSYIESNWGASTTVADMANALCRGSVHATQDPPH